MVPRHACLAACNLPPALLTEKLESFTCHCSNTRCWGWVGGLERIPKEQSAQKADHGEDNSPVDPSRTRTRDISVTSPALEPLSYIYIYVYISSILHTQIPRRSSIETTFLDFSCERRKANASWGLSSSVGLVPHHNLSEAACLLAGLPEVEL